MNERLLRPSLLSLFWTPVVAVGSHDGEQLNAQISVSTIGTSIVADRPRITVVLYKSNLTHDMAMSSGSFALSALEESQVGLLPKLGFVSGRDGDKLAGLDIEVTALGNPALRDCLGWADCEVIDTADYGDSTAFLAAVREVRELRDGAPMIWSKVRRELPQALSEQWDAKIARDVERYRPMMKWR